MDVGCGCIISDRWIPKGVDTGFKYDDGEPILTGDKVKITCCTAKEGVIGRDMKDKFVLFFGTENGSVSWSLNERVVGRIRALSDE